MIKNWTVGKVCECGQYTPVKHSNAREMVVLGGIAPYVSLDEVVVLFLMNWW